MKTDSELLREALAKIRSDHPELIPPYQFADLVYLAWNHFKQDALSERNSPVLLAQKSMAIVTLFCAFEKCGGRIEFIVKSEVPQ